jgi:hypothetical protein
MRYLPAHDIDLIGFQLHTLVGQPIGRDGCEVGDFLTLSPVVLEKIYQPVVL